MNNFGSTYIPHGTYQSYKVIDQLVFEEENFFRFFTIYEQIGHVTRTF